MKIESIWSDTNSGNKLTLKILQNENNTDHSTKTKFNSKILCLLTCISIPFHVRICINWNNRKYLKP